MYLNWELGPEDAILVREAPLPMNNPTGVPVDEKSLVASNATCPLSAIIASHKPVGVPKSPNVVERSAILVN
jgi:hypothetical protein